MRANPALDDSIYTSDFFEWSQGQARLLKSLRAVCKDVPAGLDIDNIAEEIDDLGRAELHAVEGHIRNILVYLIKAVSDVDAPAVPHWRTETTTFNADVGRTYSPSMRQRIDMDRTWRAAVRIARDALREYGVELASGVPATCPFHVDDLASEGFDFDGAVERISRLMAGAGPS